MRSNDINFLYIIPGYVNLWSVEVVPMTYASNVIQWKNMNELAWVLCCSVWQGIGFILLCMTQSVAR